MSILDIIMMIIIGASCIYGITKGFIRDVFSLIAVIVGVIAALVGYPWAAAYLSALVPAGPPANIIGFALILLIVSIGVSVLGVVISKAIAGADLSVYDRIAGACFGLIEGIVVASVIAVIAAVLTPSAVSSSRIAPYLLRGVDAAITLLPSDTREQIDSSKKTLRKLRNEMTPQATGEDKE
jgi:membrane protein required for colicin V production